MEKIPFDTSLNMDDIPKERLQMFEDEALLSLTGPVGHAFQKSYDDAIMSLVTIPLNETDKVIAMVAQLRSLVIVHENLKDLVVESKIRANIKATEDKLKDKEGNQKS